MATLTNVKAYLTYHSFSEACFQSDAFKSESDLLNYLADSFAFNDSG